MRGATFLHVFLCQDFVISIHAPHARSDSRNTATSRAGTSFQSTLLMRGATNACWCRRDDHQISIHAPHARSDAMSSMRRCRPFLFQSTLLMRGATMLIHLFSPDPRYFNPRSSCEERRPGHPLRAFRCNFNPRSSCEERQA